MAPATIKLAHCYTTATGQIRVGSLKTYDLKNAGRGDVTFDEEEWKELVNWICGMASVDPKTHRPSFHRSGACGTVLDRQAFNRELNSGTGTEFFLYHLPAGQPNGRPPVPAQNQAQSAVDEQEDDEEDTEPGPQANSAAELQESDEGEQDVELDLQEDQDDQDLDNGDDSDEGLFISQSDSRSKRRARYDTGHQSRDNDSRNVTRSKLQTRQITVIQPEDGLVLSVLQQDILDMYAIVVAFCPPAKPVTYSCVYSWKMNGGLIGNYSAATKVSNIYTASNAADDHLHKFTPDDFFADALDNRTLDAAVRDLASGRRHRDVQQHGLPLDRPMTGVLQHGIDLPDSPYPERAQDAQTPIRVVFEYINDTVGVDLHLPINNQCSLLEDAQGNFTQDTYATFLAEALSRRVLGGTWQGLTLSQLLQYDQNPNRFEFWCEFEVWVMPQWKQHEMYSWTRQPQLMPSDFIDHQVSDAHDRELYIEVHIKKRNGWVQAQDQYWQNKVNTYPPGSKFDQPQWRRLADYKNSREIQDEIRAAGGGGGAQAASRGGTQRGQGRGGGRAGRGVGKKNTARSGRTGDRGKR